MQNSGATKGSPELHRPHASTITQFRAIPEMMNGSQAMASLESHLRLFTNHEYAGAVLVTQFNDALMQRMQAQQKVLKSASNELRLSSLDAEDASDVAKRLYTDCTAHFANIGMMLDALVMNERRREEERQLRLMQAQRAMAVASHVGVSPGGINGPNVTNLNTPLASGSTITSQPSASGIMSPQRKASPSGSASTPASTVSPSPNRDRPIEFYLPHR